MHKLLFKLFMVLMLPCAGLQAQTDTIENLVFEGAGIRGLAYGGAIARLEAHGLLKNIKRVGGTSAGAITALMLSLHYSAAEISETIANTRFQKFNSGRFSIAGGIHRTNKYFGWYRGNRFAHWLDKLIAAKTGNANITFAQLKDKGFKDLYVTGTDLTAQQAVLFSHETFPHMRVRDAVRISMSIPLYFEAVFMNPNGRIVPHPKNKKDLHVLVDGGFLANFPIKIWDSTRYINNTLPNTFAVNRRTIGFRIDSEAQWKTDSAGVALTPMPVSTFKQYMIAFYTVIFENLNRQALTPDDWRRTVSISDGGVGPRIRKLAPIEVETLTGNGRKATAAYFK